MPDFDVDFCMNRRDEVIAYVTEKYGKDNVGQIVTFHQLKARSVHHATSRARWASRSPRRDKVAKLVPEPVPGQDRRRSPRRSRTSRELKALYDESADRTASCSTSAKELEGLNRHAGMHAAGVVISERPLWEYVPVLPRPERRASSPSTTRTTSRRPAWSSSTSSA